MKKGNIINLIRYYAEHDEAGFRNAAYEIAKAFDQMGDHQLAEYIMALISDVSTFVPQEAAFNSMFLEKVSIDGDALPLPDVIMNDVLGIVNAISRNIEIHKFLFQGPPGTGKTETAKQIARITNRNLYMVDFSKVIDSKLGQTQKNIVELFADMSHLPHPDKTIVLFDEIDSLALDRTNTNDVREMGRATSTFLKELDRLDTRIILIATTNLFDYLDHALIRRFDSVIDFGRYTKEDLMQIAEVILNDFLRKTTGVGKNIRLFRKILSLMGDMPFPGDLKNIIRTAIAFSSPAEEFDYLRRLYQAVCPGAIDMGKMKKQGFTVREIEILTGVSKSQVARELKEE